MQPQADAQTQLTKNIYTQIHIDRTRPCNANPHLYWMLEILGWINYLILFSGHVTITLNKLKERTKVSVEMWRFLWEKNKQTIELTNLLTDSLSHTASQTNWAKTLILWLRTVLSVALSLMFILATGFGLCSILNSMKVLGSFWCLTALPPDGSQGFSSNGKTEQQNKSMQCFRKKQ